MKNKKILIPIIIVVLVAIVIIGKSSSKKDSGSYSSYDFEITQNDVQDITSNELYHQTSVPDGYIGIYTVEDLKNVELNLNANYILMNDIDVQNELFKPYDKCYHGTFDGNNYSIKNYYSYCSLFRYADGKIMDLSFDNACIDVTTDDVPIDEPDNKGLGGIVGKLSGEMTNCHYNGTIKLYGISKQCDYQKNVGGVVGELYDENSKIKSCSFNGEIIVLDNYITRIGGIVGKASIISRRVEGCASTGKIKAIDVGEVGGIVGGAARAATSNSRLEISNCCSNMDIDVNYCGCIGGIVGYLYDGKVLNVLYTGTALNANAIFGTEYGSVQADELTEENSIKYKDVRPGAITGEINYGNIQYCYYPADSYSAVSNGAPYANVEALSKEQMKNKESFRGFDFDTVWEMGSTCPTLK